MNRNWRSIQFYVCIKIRADDSYSSFVRNVENEGYTFVYGKNICYHPKRHQYAFLIKDKRMSLKRYYGEDFKYGWEWYNKPITAEEVDAYWVEEDSYITQPYTIHHIYHFVESINFLWTQMMDPGRFPVV